MRQMKVIWYDQWYSQARDLREKKTGFFPEFSEFPKSPGVIANIPKNPVECLYLSVINLHSLTRMLHSFLFA